MVMWDQKMHRCVFLENMDKQTNVLFHLQDFDSLWLQM